LFAPKTVPPCYSATLLLCSYGLLGGGLAFSLAVFIRHPVRVAWGPFASWNSMMQWKIAEESFGLIMGLAIALGALRLLRGGLAPAEEDVPRKPLDVYAVFVVLIGLLWMNVRRTPMRWIHRHDAIGSEPIAGLAPWAWYVVFGLVMSGLGLYALRLYWRDELSFAPKSAYGKGAFVLLFLLWATIATGFTMDLPVARGRSHPLVEVTFIAFAGAVTALLLKIGNPSDVTAPNDATTPPSDPKWRLPKSFYVTCVATPWCSW
jgi:hypothetical protein